MIKLHPNILEKDGEKEFAVIPYNEFIEIQEQLDDYECIKALREAKTREANTKTISFEDAKKILRKNIAGTKQPRKILENRLRR